uniref:Zinc transporter ZIP11 n=1 Tax=Knipowitschia caucasica TaxID=637954 RepID=A0AAV2LTT4_KNICA
MGWVPARREGGAWLSQRHVIGHVDLEVGSKQTARRRWKQTRPSGTRSGTMLEGYGPVTQALLGTLFTWALTAAGAALVFVFSSRQKRILDGSLGFAAGVMLAASYWSLLAPALSLAEDSGKYGQFSFAPVAVGFTLGAGFVYVADLLMPLLRNTAVSMTTGAGSRGEGRAGLPQRTIDQTIDLSWFTAVVEVSDNCKHCHC